MTPITFFGWWRPPGAGAVSSSALTAGRLTASLQLTASDLDKPSDSSSRTLSYDLFGPGDVTGLARGAVIHTYPSPGARTVEIDKAVYAELGARDLPWRHTVALPQGRALRPWIVLLVGTVDEIELTGETVRLQPSVLDAHPLADSARGAHVEQDASGRSISRLISPRALPPDRDHVAVIVPAFTAAGTPAWSRPAGRSVELVAYHHWEFHTRTGGDFSTLARRLKLRAAGPELGSSAVEYGPIPTAPALAVRGALVSTAADAAAPVPADVAADVAALTAPLGEAARPILGLPDHAAPWPSPSSPPLAHGGWRDALRGDHRVRAVAGLGSAAGIVNQELLAREAARVAGAFEEAADRLRRLSLGLLASRSLWKRRVPADGARRLSLLGPALRDVLTAGGSVAEVIEHRDRALERSLFSSAAQRALRPRDGDDAASGPATGAALRLAAAAPPRRVRSGPDAIHMDTFARERKQPALDDGLIKAAPSPKRLRATATRLAAALDRRDLDADTASVLDGRLRTVFDRLAAGRPVPILPLLSLVDSGGRLSRERVRRLAAGLSAEPDSDDLAALASKVARPAGQPVATGFDLDRASSEIAAAFDPSTARPPLVDRVLSGVVDAVGSVLVDPTAPVEMAPDLDLPAWQFLRDNAPEWLLPGAGTLPEDTVVALTTNPAFVDAFLLGLNAQVVAELRFRNHPVIPGWTPVRTFWDRVNVATAGVDDDIVDIGSWEASTTFGAASHQTPSASSADLVLLFNTPLFREYPGTLVYLVPAKRDAAGALDWTDPPRTIPPSLDEPQFPSFQGRISSDQMFFGFDLDPVLGSERWVVLEETVSGRRFFNAGRKRSVASDGAKLALDTLSPPRRVLIRGDILLGGVRP
jgi:hypothetical protein